MSAATSEAEGGARTVKEIAKEIDHGGGEATPWFDYKYKGSIIYCRARRKEDNWMHDEPIVSRFPSREGGKRVPMKRRNRAKKFRTADQAIEHLRLLGEQFIDGEKDAAATTI